MIRTDRNGTKYYHVVEPCGKCQGQGYIQYYHYNEGGICFQCNGSGVVEYEDKEYTEEHLKKLAEQRKKREERKNAKRKAQTEELNRDFCERNGFAPDGKAYVVLGDAYAIKDKLKALGMRYKPEIGWYSPEKVKDIDMMETSVYEAYNTDNCDVLLWNSPKKRYFFQGEEVVGEDVDYCDTWEFNVAYKVKLENAKLLPESNYLGNVGERISVEVKLKHLVDMDYNIGWKSICQNLYVMEDKDGNVITWKTQGWLEFRDKASGESKSVDTEYPFTITGTVKEHTEYRGVKQTVLTRCKVFSEHTEKER